MSSHFLLPLLFLSLYLTQPTPGYAGGFLEAKSYPGGAGTLAMATGDFNGDGHVDVALANSTDVTVGIVLGNSDGSFQAPMNFIGGSAVDHLAVGDFNGDGKLDVVTVNHLTDNANILFGNGDGTLQTVHSYATGSAPRAVDVGDFNGNGKLDVVTANQNGTISVLLGNGNGTFAPHMDFAVAYEPSLVAVGDFNGDNKADILVSTQNRTAMSLLLGNGDGTFQGPRWIANFDGHYGLLIADLNGDGRVDFAASGLVTVGVFLGNGDGSFQPETDYSLYSNAGLAAVDLNGDGNLDLISGGSGAAVLLGSGNGTFGLPTYFGSVNGDSFIATVDVNGDNKFDIIGTQYFYTLGAVDVLIGLGDGGFIARRDFDGGGTSADASVARDFNNDGKVDVALVTDTNGAKVGVLLGNGDGTLSDSGMQFTTGHLPMGLATGDLNGDGKLDLAVALSGGVSILLGNGNGTFKNHLDYGNVNRAYNLVIGDFNGDGKLDVAAPDYGNSLLGVLLGNGDGTLQAQANYPVGKYAYQPATGDFNRDGKLDLVVTNEGSDSLSLLFGNGDGTFQSQVQISTGDKSYPRVIAVADLNRDGKLDLAFTTWCEDFDKCFFQASVMLGHGDGTFASAVNYSLPFGYAPTAIAIGDVNADGKRDLVTAVDNTGEEISVLLGNGDGTFQPRADYAGGGFSVALADFNRDGALDVASGGGLLSILLNTGGTAFKATASPNPAKQGQPVMFVASLIATVVDQPVPTGTVILKDGSTTLAVLTLRAGRAHFRTSNLSVGTHVVTATYSGDSNFIPNTAKPITLSVTP